MCSAGPQGLEPRFTIALYGTAKAVPSRSFDPGGVAGSRALPGCLARGGATGSRAPSKLGGNASLCQLGTATFLQLFFVQVSNEVWIENAIFCGSVLSRPFAYGERARGFFRSTSPTRCECAGPGY